MSGPERRKYERYRLDLPVTLSVAGRWMRGKILDISAGGLQVHADDEIAPSRTVRLRLLRRDQECTATGITRWSRGRGVGIEFDEIDPALRALLDDFSTLRPTFHRTLVAQLSEAELTWE